MKRRKMLGATVIALIGRIMIAIRHIEVDLHLVTIILNIFVIVTGEVVLEITEDTDHEVGHVKDI